MLRIFDQSILKQVSFFVYKLRIKVRVKSVKFGLLPSSWLSNPFSMRIREKQNNAVSCGSNSGSATLVRFLLCCNLTFSSETMQRDSRSRHLDSLRQRSSSLLISTHSSVIRPLSNLHKSEFITNKGLFFRTHPVLKLMEVLLRIRDPMLF